MAFIASAASATPRSISSRFVAGMIPKSLPSSGKCFLPCRVLCRHPAVLALITEVSPYFSDQTVSFDHCNAKDVVYNEEPENSINYVLMDISSSLLLRTLTPFGTSVAPTSTRSRTSSSSRTKEVDAAMLAETTT